ncbi:MAG: hypothetical protein ABFC31_09285 [Clostridiaceae bacterium]
MENDENSVLEEPTFESWHKDICEQCEHLFGIQDEETRGYLLTRVINRILERLKSSESSVENAMCLGLLQGILVKSEETTLINALILQTGISVYEEGNFLLAELLFRFGTINGNRGAQNNLAYMIRRNEAANPTNHSIIEAFRLLRDGVRDKEAFSLVNMALVLSLRLGTEDDWLFADRLMSFVPSERALGVASWWEQVEKSGDPEGDLVHLWLLRHRKMAISVLGTQESIFKRLSVSLPALPGWMRSLA